MNLRQIQEHFFQVWGQRVLSTGAIKASFANTDAATRHINTAIKKLATENEFTFLRTEGQVRLRNSVDLAVTVTQFSTAVTAITPVIDRAFEGQILRIGDEEHRIRSVTSTTTLTLEDPVLRTTSVGLTVTTDFDLYKFPRNFLKYYTGKQLNTPSEIVTANSFWEIQHFLLFQNLFGVVDRIDLDFKSTEVDHYNTGTVTMVLGDATVEGAGGTLWTTLGNVEPGMIFKLANEDIEYIVDSVTDADTLELTTPYRGTNVTAGEAYAVDPAGVRRFRIFDYPDATFYAKLEYQRKPNMLVLQTDTPHPIPEEYHETAIVMRAVYEGAIFRQLPVAITRPFLDESRAAVVLMLKGSNPNSGRSGYRLSRLGEQRGPVVGRIRSNQIATDAP